MIELRNSTGSDRIDAGLRNAIRVCEQKLPDLIRAYYIVGSYADGSAIEESDLDFEVITKADIGSADRERANRISKRLNQDEPPCGFSIRSEASLSVISSGALRLNSLFLFGEDIREKIPFPSISDYARAVAAQGVNFSWTRIRRSGLPARLPFGYPDTDDDFLGYFRSGRTKDLVQTAFWGATSILATEFGEYVTNRVHALELWEARVADHWTVYLQQLYKVLRNDLRYKIPTRRTERKRVRRLCEATLDFENHVAARFQAFVTQERRDSSPNAVAFVEKCDRNFVPRGG